MKALVLLAVSSKRGDCGIRYCGILFDGSTGDSKTADMFTVKLQREPSRNVSE